MWNFSCSRCHPFQCCSRAQDFNSESTPRRPKISLVERDNCVSHTVDRRFQDHFVGRVAKLRTPEEFYLDRLGDSNEDIHDIVCVSLAQARCIKVFRTTHRR